MNCSTVGRIEESLVVVCKNQKSMVSEMVLDKVQEVLGTLHFGSLPNRPLSLE